MKKVISLLMSVVMLMSITAGLNLTANAAEDYTSISTNVPLNGIWSGDYWLTETTDEQWYRITIPSDGKLELRLRSYSFTRLQLFNYDLSKEIIDSWDLRADGTDTAPQTSTCIRVLSTGTYYAKTTGSTGKYNLYASYESYGVNDFNAYSFDSPQDLAQNYEITGAITETDGEDWFRIQIPANARYTFKLTSYNYKKLRLYNYDLSKEIIGNYDLETRGTDVAPETKRTNKILSPGTYYIKVSGSNGKYLMSWYALTPENCTHEFENKEVDSTCTTQGYTLHTCKICGYSYSDNYKDLADHNYNSQTVYPTYFAKGYTTYTCVNCGNTYRSYISKLKVAKPSIRSLKKGKKQFAISFSNYYGLDGIQIQYSTGKKFTKKSTKTASTTKTYKVFKKLKGNKKYYVRIRGYKKVGNKRAYSSWSKVKSVKTK